MMSLPSILYFNETPLKNNPNGMMNSFFFFFLVSYFIVNEIGENVFSF